MEWQRRMDKKKILRGKERKREKVERKDFWCGWRIKTDCCFSGFQDQWIEQSCSRFIAKFYCNTTHPSIHLFFFPYVFFAFLLLLFFQNGGPREHIYIVGFWFFRLNDLKRPAAIACSLTTFPATHTHGENYLSTLLFGLSSRESLKFQYPEQFVGISGNKNLINC